MEDQLIFLILTKEGEGGLIDLLKTPIDFNGGFIEENVAGRERLTLIHSKISAN